MIQPFSFALPCTLVVPITIILIVVSTDCRNQNASVFSGILPNYVFFNSPQIYDTKKFFFNEVITQTIWFFFF